MEIKWEMFSLLGLHPDDIVLGCTSTLRGLVERFEVGTLVMSKEESVQLMNHIPQE
jgi:hypothetical protein